MFTSIDKALAGVFIGVLFLLNEFAGIDFGVSEGAITMFFAGVIPLLVYFVPNKK